MQDNMYNKLLIPIFAKLKGTEIITKQDVTTIKIIKKRDCKPTPYLQGGWDFLKNHIRDEDFLVKMGV